MMNRVFIGWDPRQPVSYTVLQHSIITRSSQPVSIAPLVLSQLPLKRAGLTEFTFSRFLVPWLCEFKGVALFTDVDVLVRGNVCELLAMANDDAATAAVWVSKNKLKYEWASVMLFDCEHPDNAVLTPEYVEKAAGLHQIGWTPFVGDLPSEWNHLVGYDPPRDDAKLLHYTQGIPAYPETLGGGYAKEWKDEARAAMATRPWAELMGNSVHAGPVYERLGRAKAAE